MRIMAIVVSFAALTATGQAAHAEDAGAALSRSATDAALAWGPCPDFMPKGCEISVLHGDPAQPGADVFFRVPGGSVVPRHTHTSEERMVLVAGEMQVTYDGQATQVLKPGMYAYGPPNVPHEATCSSSETCVLFIAFTGAVDATLAESPAGS